MISIRHNAFLLFKWIIAGIVLGIVSGAAGASFALATDAVTQLRGDHQWLLYLLPLAGILTVALYRVGEDDSARGVSLVLQTINGEDRLPFRVSVKIYLAAVLSHLCGASTGRIGSSLQIGCGIGDGINRLLHLSKRDGQIMAMAATGGAFAGLFGTPLSAAFFVMEFVTIGNIYYYAMIPCVTTTLVAALISRCMGVSPTAFAITPLPLPTPALIAKTAILSIACAVIAALFCLSLHHGVSRAKKLIPNPFLRIITGAFILILLTNLVGDMTYSGTGLGLIPAALTGDVPDFGFLLKILFTTITLAAGFKGGDIAPSLSIGALCGAAFSHLSGLDPALAVSCGMGALFCGVTNCPVASLFLCFELFGFSGMPYYLITIALSYALSGSYSIYSTQRILYEKI